MLILLPVQVRAALLELPNYEQKGAVGMVLASEAYSTF
jgi:hypothetical protein